MTSAELQVVFSFQHSSGARARLAVALRDSIRRQNRRTAMLESPDSSWSVRSGSCGRSEETKEDFSSEKNSRDETLHQATSGLSSVGQSGKGVQERRCLQRPAICTEAHSAVSYGCNYCYLLRTLLGLILSRSPRPPCCPGPRAIDECDGCTAAATPTPLPAIWDLAFRKFGILEPWNQPGRPAGGNYLASSHLRCSDRAGNHARSRRMHMYVPT
mgnify:FL=1